MLKGKIISWPCCLLPQVHQELCLESKTPHSPYSSWCKVCLDISPPHSIQYPQKCFVRSTYLSLRRSFKMLYSVYRCLRWCLWSSVVTGIWWPTTSSCISLTQSQTPNGNGAPQKTEAYDIYYAVTKWNDYLQGSDIIVCNDHKPLQKLLNGKNSNKVNRRSLEIATYNIIFE